MKLIFWSRPRPAFSGQAVLAALTEFTYLAAIFIVPLWFAYWFPTYHIFELNKLIILQLLTALLLALTLLTVIFYPLRLKMPSRIFFKKYWLVPLIFISGLSLLLALAVDPVLSFYGEPERQGGLISYFWYFLWFILLSFNLLNDQGRIRRLLMTATMAGTLVALYGVLQILNIDFLTWPESAYLTGRTFSTFGQPNFLASWLLLVIPLSAYLFWVSRSTWLRLAWALAGLIQLAAFFTTGSRGGLVALFFAAGIFFIVKLIQAGWTKKKKYSAVGIFFLAALSFLIIFNTVAPGRLRQSLDFNYGSTGARANFYRAAVAAIGARPLVGYGLDSGENIFIKYYEPDWAVFGSVGQSADRAHNLLLDLWLSGGLVGVGLFILLYYFFFRLNRINLRPGGSRYLSWALILGVSAYLFSLLFSFSFVAGEMYFWLFLAVAVALNFQTQVNGSQDQPAAAAPARENIDLIPKFILVVVVLLLAFGLINRSRQTLVADYYFARLSEALTVKDYFTMLVIDGYQRSTPTNPVNQASYDHQLADKLSDLYPSIWELTPQAVVKQKLLALDQAIAPRGYKNLLVKAKINLALDNLAAARSYLSAVVALTPHWPLTYIVSGEVETKGGDYAAALAAYRLAADFLPAVSDPRLNDQHRQEVKNYNYFIAKQMASVYFQQKNYESAGKYYRAAYSFNPDDLALLKNIADTYYLRSDRIAAITYTLHGFDRDPSDYHWSLAAADLYYENGDRTKALVYLAIARRLAPDNQEVKSLEKKYRP